MSRQASSTDMDHTPMVPADERALTVLAHAALPDETKARLAQLVHHAQDTAKAAGAELQAEFGREHVGLIVGCNQFLRLWRAGADPGAVELLLDAPGKERLKSAGFALRDPEGQVFKLFGWVRLDPRQGDSGALDDAVAAAFRKAKAAAKR